MRGVVLFDGDCGFCTRSAGWLERLGCDVEVTPYQRWPHLAAWGITTDAADEALHAVIDDRVVVGHEAVASALSTSRYAGARGVGRLVGSRAVAPVAARVYAWVAAHRHQLPGGTPACAIPDAPR